MSGGRRFEVSGTQIVAGVLATVTGAVAASYLGVAGTVIGAAVMSVASTGGGAVYKYYLGRTARRMREAAPVITQRTVERAAAVGVRSAARRGVPSDHPADRPPTGDAADDLGAGLDGTEGKDPRGPKEHQADRSGDRGDQGHRDGSQGDRAAGSRYSEAGSADGAADRAGHAGEPGERAGDPGDRAGDRAGHAGDPGQRTAAGEHGPGTGKRVRPAWLAVAIGTAGIFIGVIAAITVFELAAGKPLEAVVWNRHSSGTSVGQIVGVQGSSKAHPRQTPPASPRATASSRATSPASTHTTPVSPSASPTSSRTGSPSPSPSSHPSPSPSASHSRTPAPTHTP
jgi:hypothetical protein